MDKALSRFEDAGYALLRFVAGFLFAFHGMQKILGMYGGTTQEVFTRAWVAGVIELVAGPLIAVGLLTSPLAFLSSGLMAFAYFLAHQPRGFWPVENRGELAALYCFVFLYLSMKGSGRFSLDAVLGRAGKGR
ncbi:MAG: DoxX family protein [Vicinamibacterales bacterium]|jgi:putative oxidoreductase|nr:DoxX family protein [Vicinamibacterales bacterium]